MTFKEALLFGEVNLKKMETPNLDAAVLLAFVAQKPKIFLYAHGEQTLAPKQWLNFKKLIKRRVKHEPIAYLVGEKEFYGRSFFVDKRVLIPRPGTELIIDIAKNIQADNIIDVGTGSGAIAITLAKELNQPVTAIDISSGALAVVKKNAKRHHAKVKFIHGNLLEPFLKEKKLKAETWKLKAILVVANLPYLPQNRAKFLSMDIKKYEPMLALYGGRDGLKLYRQLLQELKIIKSKKWTLVAEIDSLQEKTFTQMTKKILPKAELEFKKDLAGHIRVAILTTN